jgi:Domain of unknown function (DUF1707)
MPEPHLRAADADRAAVAETLGAHMSAGRLTVAEFDERLARAYAAKTYGELAELTVDLPPLAKAGAASVPAPRQDTQPAPRATASPSPWAGGWDQTHSWRAWLTTSLIVLTIWAATSLASWEFHYFWPVWVIGPWGAVLLAQTLTGAGKNDDRPDRHLRA